MKKPTVLLVIMVAFLTDPRGVSAAVNWEIADGDPDYWLSDAIVVRHQGDDIFDVNAEAPPGPWQEPIPGQMNWVWVRVRKNGSFDGGQVGKLRLFVGRADADFIASDYDFYDPFNTNILDPPESPIWTDAEWASQLTDNKVVPLRTVPALALEYDLTNGGPYTPGPSGFKWLRFAWETHRIPAAVGAQCTPMALVAYIYDPQDYQGADVPTDGNLAQRNFNALPGCLCGDLIARDDEVCDGTDLRGLTCWNLGFDGGALACNGACDGYDLSGCLEPADVCGDDVADPEEMCDGSDLRGATCVVLGFGGGNLACTDGCDALDTSGCESPGAVCADGVIQSPEECDDENSTDGDGCAADCTLESGWTCTAAPSLCTMDEHSGECGCATAGRSAGELPMAFIFLAMVAVARRRRPAVPATVFPP